MLESVKLLVLSACRFTQMAKTAKKASTDAATIRASPALRCERCADGEIDRSGGGSGVVTLTICARSHPRQERHNGVCLSVGGGARTPFC